MNRFKITGCIVVVSVLVAACMYALNSALEPPISPRSRVLFIGSGSGEHWQRTIDGARAAAKALDIELDVETQASEVPNQQNTLVRRIGAPAYDGVVISPTDADSQLELLNDLAERTKLVTIDRDVHESKRLCHIAYGQNNAGRLVARLVADQLTRSGKVALLTSSLSEDASNSKASQRLAGFKELWGASGPDDARACPIIQIVTSSDSAGTPRADLHSILADPEVAYVVALDSKAAETALDALAGQSEKQHAPIIAFDPSDAIFDAIDDGRISSAIFDDPYQLGFVAIQQLSVYRFGDKYTLPMPGFGYQYLVSEVVKKENLTDVRRRAGWLPSIPPRSLTGNFRISQSRVQESASNRPL